MNARRAPGWVLGHHAEDEPAEFHADTLSAGANLIPREPTPVHLESGTVPSHHGFRLDENQHPFLSAPAPLQYHQTTCQRSKSGLRMPPLQNGELLPKRKVLQEEVTASRKGLGSQNKQKR